MLYCGLKNKTYKKSWHFKKMKLQRAILPILPNFLTYFTIVCHKGIKKRKAKKKREKICPYKKED